MAGKEASFARLDPGSPLSSSAETTPDFDALERAAESIRPAWDGIAAPTPSIPPPAPVPAAAFISPASADSTHRMRAQLPATDQLDDLGDLALRGKRRPWLAPALIGGVVLAGLGALLLRSPDAPVSVPAVSVPAAPSATAAPAPSVGQPVAAPAPVAVAPAPEAPVAAPQPVVVAPEPAPAPAVTPLVAPDAPVEKAALGRAKRRDKRTVKPAPAKVSAPKPVLAKKPEPVRKPPAAVAKPAESSKPRKGVGFVSDNPY